MGSKFVEGRSVEFSKSYEESSPSTPIFFILSPGVDPLKDVEALGTWPAMAPAPENANHAQRGDSPVGRPLQKAREVTSTGGAGGSVKAQGPRHPTPGCSFTAANG